MHEKRSSDLEKKLHLFFFLLLSGAFFIGYTAQQLFCPGPSFYCPIKRACLTALLWTLFYGIHKRITAKTYALSLLFSLCGAAVSLKEARLFVCLKDKENPNTQILGFSSYSWSFILFCICIFSLSALLILHKRSDVQYNHRATFLEKILLIVLIGITLMSFYSMRTLVF